MMAARNVGRAGRGSDRGRAALFRGTPFGGFGSRFRVHPPQRGFPANFAYASPKTKNKNAVAAMERLHGGVGSPNGRGNGDAWRRPGVGDGVETRRETRRLAHRERGKRGHFSFFPNGTARTGDEEVEEGEAADDAAVLVGPERGVEIRGESVVFDPVPLQPRVATRRRPRAWAWTPPRRSYCCTSAMRRRRGRPCSPCRRPPRPRAPGSAAAPAARTRREAWTRRGPPCPWRRAR